jgi:hypothetical protein
MDVIDENCCLETGQKEEENWQSEDESHSEKESYESVEENENEESDENEEDNENDAVENEGSTADTTESKQAKRMNRQLSTAGFQIFVHHYLSMEWLRKYLLKLTVQDLVQTDEDRKQEIEDEDDYYSDSRSVEPQLKRKEFYNDLVFLFRTATEWFPTAQVFSAVMKLFDVFEKNVSITANQFNINSIYFSVEMNIKASMNSCWKKVATIPLGLQWKHRSLYALAKAKEMANHVSSYETELYTVFQKPASSHLLETWRQTDRELRREIENGKSFDDRMKYYQALSVQGRDQGHSEVFDAWNELIKLERSGKNSLDKSLLIAWCLQREIDSPTAGRIWRVAAELLKTGAKISADTVKTARFAFDLEKLLSELLKTESNMNSLQEQKHSISQLRLVVNEIVRTIRSTLVEKDKFITVINVMEAIESVTDTFSEITNSFSKCIQTFIQTVSKKNNLLRKFREIPEVVGIIDAKFANYTEELENHLQKVLQKCKGSDWKNTISMSAPLCNYRPFFDNLPFQNDLENYSKKLEAKDSFSPRFEKVFKILLVLLSRQPVEDIFYVQHYLKLEDCINPIICYINDSSGFEMRNFIVDAYLEFCWLHIHSSENVAHLGASEVRTVTNSILIFLKGLGKEGTISSKELNFLEKTINYVRRSTTSSNDESFKLSIFQLFFRCLDLQPVHDKERQYEVTSEALQYLVSHDPFHAYLTLLKLVITPELLRPHYETLFQTSLGSLNLVLVHDAVKGCNTIIDKMTDSNNRSFSKRWNSLLYIFQAVVKNSQVLLNQWKYAATQVNTQEFEGFVSLLLRIEATNNEIMLNENNLPFLCGLALADEKCFFSGKSTNRKRGHALVLHALDLIEEDVSALGKLASQKKVQTCVKVAGWYFHSCSAAIKKELQKYSWLNDIVANVK